MNRPMIIAPLIISSLLIGCVTEKKPTFKDVDQQISAVSTAAPFFKPTQAMKYTWAEPITFYTPNDIQVDDATRNWVNQSLNTELKQHGYPLDGYALGNETQSSDYKLKAAVVVGKDAQSDEIYKHLGIDAALHTENGDQNTGNLVLVFINTTTQSVDWRGVIQMTVLEEADFETRQTRIGSAVRQLVQAIPKPK